MRFPKITKSRAVCAAAMSTMLLGGAIGAVPASADDGCTSRDIGGSTFFTLCTKDFTVKAGEHFYGLVATASASGQYAQFITKPTIRIDWGDGSGEDLWNADADGNVVAGHTYATAKSYTVTTTFATVSDTGTATVVPAVTEVVKGQGVSKIGTAFSLSVTKTAAGVIGGHLKFANAKSSPALREGDVTCAKFGAKRAVIGMIDKANETHPGDVYREFYVEDEPKGFRLTGVLSSATLPAAGASCRTKMPKANTGGLIRSGSMTFPSAE